MTLSIDNFTITGDVDEIYAFLQRYKGTSVGNSINIPQTRTGNDTDYEKLFGLDKETK